MPLVIFLTQLALWVPLFLSQSKLHVFFVDPSFTLPDVVCTFGVDKNGKCLDMVGTDHSPAALRFLKREGTEKICCMAIFRDDGVSRVIYWKVLLILILTSPPDRHTVIYCVDDWPKK